MAVFMRTYYDKIYKGTKKEFLNLLKERIADGKQAFVITANPEILMLGRKLPEMNAALMDEETLIVPDGIGVIRGGAQLGYEFKERIPGVEICEALFDYADKKGCSIYLFGAEKSVLEDLALMPVLVSELAPGRTLPRRHVLIWDHFGDLPDLYAAARAVFVGGSFGQGGQNFLESLSAGRIPCIGPSAHNFLWAMGTGDPSMPSLEEAGLLRVAHTPREVINIMIRQAASTRDRTNIRNAFQEWLTPRLGGALRSARLMEEAVRSR